MQESRTKKSLRNTIVALLIFLLNLILQFFFRKVFLDALGPEALGLNTTITSILQFLNIAELGVGTACSVLLYEPLAKEDYTRINELVSVLGLLYRRIAFFILIVGAIVLCFFPIIFEKSTLPLYYSYISFFALICNSILGYFVNYRQVVLSANQEEYKILFGYRFILLIKILVQIILLKTCDNGFLLWAGTEVLFSVVASISLELITKKAYPKLQASYALGKDNIARYPEFIRKIKQLFFHRIATFALNQTSPLILYAYSNLTIVSAYGNYLLIISGLVSLLNALFNGLISSIGNLIAESTTESVFSVFQELFSIRFLIVSVLSWGLYMFAEPFISLWVGADYLLDNVSLILLVLFFFINSIRNVVDMFISAFGLFQDIWAPIAEALLNICLSILLGNYFGLHGILTGIIISLVVIVMIWKPYFLFSRAIHESVLVYWALLVKHLLCLFFAIIISKGLQNILPHNYDSWTGLCFGGVLSFLLFGIILYVILFITEKGMRQITKRIISFFFSYASHY